VNKDESVRLNKLLALRLGTSRREADDLITSERVSVDGTTAKLGARADANSLIEIDGKALQDAPELTYVLFNKPVGYVCSRKAQGENPTIYDLLPKDMYALKPVGRLDKNSSGLILLTNDGDFAHQMTHPKFAKVKVYQVTLDRP
jgi:23S rRNA pseudouridine2605 synthase